MLSSELMYTTIGISEEQNRAIRKSQDNYFPTLENEISSVCVHTQPYCYPPIPNIAHRVTEVTLPNTSGVYFVYNQYAHYRIRKTLYVGCSKNMRQRINSHNAFVKCKDTYINWLEFDAHKIKYAEAFYIGLLQPEFNFNSSAQQKQRINHKAAKQIQNMEDYLCS